MVSTGGRSGFVPGRSLEERRRERPGHPHRVSPRPPLAGARENRGGCPVGPRGAAGEPPHRWARKDGGGRTPGRGDAMAPGEEDARAASTRLFAPALPVPRGPLAMPRQRHPATTTRTPHPRPAHRAPLRAGPAGNGRYNGGGGESAVPSTGSALRPPRRAPSDRFRGGAWGAGAGLGAGAGPGGGGSGWGGGSGPGPGPCWLGSPGAGGAPGSAPCDASLAVAGGGGGVGPPRPPASLLAHDSGSKAAGGGRRLPEPGQRPRGGRRGGSAGCRWAKAAAATGIWKVPARPSVPPPPPPPPRPSPHRPPAL